MKILRAVQEGKVRRLGENDERPVNVRVVAATNRDLEAMVRERSFREDLFHRLAYGVVRLPPLLAAGRVVREGGGAQTRYSLAPAAESSDADPRWATIRAMTAREGRMTRKRAAELLGLCERSATRILNAMVEAGLLVDCGARGRAAGYLLPAEASARAAGDMAASRVPRACQGTGRPSLLLVDTGTAGVDSPGRRP